MSRSRGPMPTRRSPGCARTSSGARPAARITRASSRTSRMPAVPTRHRAGSSTDHRQPTTEQGGSVNLHATADRLAQLEALDKPAGAAANAVVKGVGQGRLKDILSGTFLGHPLHPLLTDVPIGAFTSATVLDLVGGERGESAADLLVGVGLLSALPTAAAGAADWSDSYGPDQRLGAVHAIANVIGLALYGCSLRARSSGNRRS